MFEKKRCKNCGERIREGWAFCPACGENIEEEKGREMVTPFGSIFEDIDKDFESIDRIFGSSLFKMPKFRRFPARGGGISIIITSGTGRQPKVEVKTSGDYKKIEPNIKRRFGAGEGIREVEEQKPKKRKIPKITEEPEMKVEKLGNAEIITIKLPDVKKPENVEIKKLEQSIEVKAFAGNKAYFKLIPISPDSIVSDKILENGVLKIKIER